MTTPKISVVSPSYNNARYLNDFIDSILNQTEPDFELIIVDDASTDQTQNIIKQYGDSRIKLITHAFQQGINAGLNHGIEQAAAPVITKIDADDVVEPTFIEKTLRVLEEHPDKGVVYVSLSCITEKGRPLPRKLYLAPDLTREESLNRMFFDRNCLAASGIVFRKSVIQPLLPLHTGVLHFSDSLMHILILIDNDLFILDEELVKYRRQNFWKAKNSSARNAASQRRTVLETDVQMNAFLNIKDVQNFKAIFGNNPVLQDMPPTSETIPFLLGFMALQSNKLSKRMWGYHAIMTFISVPERMALVNRLYNFNFKKFLNLAKSKDLDIIVNQNSIRLIRFLRKLYMPYDYFRMWVKAKRKKY